MAEADLILNVIDASHKHYIDHERTVNQLLRELDAHHIPKLIVYNKKDQIQNHFIPSTTEDSILISAFSDEDIEQLIKLLKAKVEEHLIPYTIHVPIEDGKTLALLESKTVMTEKEWVEDEEVFIIKGMAPKQMANFIFNDQ